MGLLNAWLMSSLMLLRDLLTVMPSRIRMSLNVLPSPTDKRNIINLGDVKKKKKKNKTPKRYLNEAFCCYFLCKKKKLITESQNINKKKKKKKKKKVLCVDITL